MEKAFSVVKTASRGVANVIDNKTGAIVGTVAGGVVTMMPGMALAAADYTDLVAAADFAGLGTAAAGVIVGLIGVSLLIGGGILIWRLVKGGRSA